MNKDGFRIILLVVAVSLFTSFASADIEKKSSIMGSLVGASKAPLAGVTVRLVDSFFLVEVSKSVTDKNGNFILPEVFPGLYLVSVDLPGIAGMFKRVQVVSDVPTIVDLSTLLNAEELKEHSAWDKFKWTIRVAERNPLHQNENPVETETSNSSPDGGLLTFIRNLKESNNISGRVSYLNVGSHPSGASFGHQMTQFAVQGELENVGRWSIDGHMLDGPVRNYSASGDFEYSLFGHHVSAAVAANDLVFARYPDLMHRQLIRKFIQSPVLEEPGEPSRLWIGSMDLQDRWSPFSSLEIGYATRIDYYGYLENRVNYSPRVEMIYRLKPEYEVHLSYYRNQSAPGNYYLQPNDVHPYIHNVAFVPYSDSLQPQTAQGVQVGIGYSSDQMQMSAAYIVETVENKIATIDLSESPAFEQLGSNQPFVIFNAADLSSKGVAFQVSKRINPVLTAMGSYNATFSIPVFIIEKNSFTDRQIYFRQGDQMEDYHDFQAGIEANIRRTLTQVQADWKWSSGSPLVFGRGDTTALSAVDVEVHQGLPVQVFAQTELKLMVAIKNLLDQNSDSPVNADFERALLYGMPRVVAGGVLLQF